MIYEKLIMNKILCKVCKRPYNHEGTTYLEKLPKTADIIIKAFVCKDCVERENKERVSKTISNRKKSHQKVI